MRHVGIDTNVLLRLVVNDDPEQRRLVTKFGSTLNNEVRGLVTLVGLLEFNWALGSQYGFARGQVVAAMRKIMAIRGVDIECHNVVELALALVEEGNADFADALIAERSRDVGCEVTVTLDRKAVRKIPSMEVLA